MKKQIVHIHGGEAFTRYEDFMTFLKSYEVDDPRIEGPVRWKHTFVEDLGEDYEVFMPKMPNARNAKYEEWKIWFEKYFQFLNDGVILMGASLGGIFLAKYLTENTVPVKVRAALLIAAPFEKDTFGLEDGGDFYFDTTKLADGVKDIEDVFIFHSKDDELVPFIHAEKYEASLPDAHFEVFEDRGHAFDHFPELIQIIKKLS